MAKDKATEFTIQQRKEKQDEVTKSIQEQSGQLVDKVKSMTSKTSMPWMMEQHPLKVKKLLNLLTKADKATIS